MGRSALREIGQAVERGRCRGVRAHARPVPVPARASSRPRRRNWCAGRPSRPRSTMRR